MSAAAWLILPTFNEAENVGPLVEALGAALSDVPYEIIVVDDDIPDRTWAVAGDIAARDPRVRVIRRFGDYTESAFCNESPKQLLICRKAKN